MPRADSCNSIPDVDEWRALLTGLPAATVYHSPEFLRALQLAGLRTVVVQARRGGSLVGMGLVLLDRMVPLPIIGMKAFAPAGLLACDEDVRRELQERLDHLLKRRCLYFEQYVEGRDQDALMAELGLRTTRHRNFLVDLGRPLAEIHGGYHRGIRRNIQAAESRGFRWRLARGVEDLGAVHRLLQATSNRVSAPPLPWALLKAVYHELVPSGMCRIYLAEREGDRSIPVNTRVELIFNGRAIDWYTGTDDNWTESQVGTWLVDRILTDLHGRGLKTFDFGGGGRVGEVYGPAEFKRRFGGREIEVSRHQRIYHPRLLRASRLAWRLLHR